MISKKRILLGLAMILMIDGKDKIYTSLWGLLGALFCGSMEIQGRKVKEGYEWCLFFAAFCLFFCLYCQGRINGKEEVGLDDGWL